MGKTQTAKIAVKGSNYPIVRFFMWVGIASFAMMFIALWFSKFALAAVGFTLLVIARGAGGYFQSMGPGGQDGLRCKKCGQPVDLLQALSSAPPTDRVARCQYCGEPVGKFSSLPTSKRRILPRCYFNPSSFSNSVSVRVVTPSSLALSCFDPGSVPTTT
jgi:DNA-directed RNA polymerase subunit RPC12/RpoP